MNWSFSWRALFIFVQFQNQWDFDWTTIWPTIACELIDLTITNQQCRPIETAIWMMRLQLQLLKSAFSNKMHCWMQWQLIIASIPYRGTLHVARRICTLRNYSVLCIGKLAIVKKASTSLTIAYSVDSSSNESRVDLWLFVIRNIDCVSTAVIILTQWIKIINNVNNGYGERN